MYFILFHFICFIRFALFCFQANILNSWFVTRRVSLERIWIMIEGITFKNHCISFKFRIFIRWHWICTEHNVHLRDTRCYCHSNVPAGTRSCYIIPDDSLTGMLTPRHVYSERPGDLFIAQSGGNWKKNNKFTHDLDFTCFYLRMDWGLIRWVIPALDLDTLVIYRSSYFFDTRAARIPAF